MLYPNDSCNRLDKVCADSPVIRLNCGQRISIGDYEMRHNLDDANVPTN